MCKVGDIILICNASANGTELKNHPFVIIDDENGVVRGIYQYDFIALVMSSMETTERRKKMLKYPGNFPIIKEDKNVLPEFTNLNSFAKAEQFFYFSKSEVDFIPFGQLDEDILDLLLEFIDELNTRGIAFKQILDNATKIKTSQ